MVNNCCHVWHFLKVEPWRRFCQLQTNGSLRLHLFTNCNYLNSLHSAKHNKIIILYDVGLFPSKIVNKKAYLSDLLHSKQVSAIQNFVDNFYFKIYQEDIWYCRHTCSSTYITDSLIYLYGHLPCIFIQYGGLNLWSRPTQTTKASTYTATRYMVSMVDSSLKKIKKYKSYSFNS